MQCKKEEAYRHVFSYIVRDTNVDVLTAKVDYEQAFIKAVRDEFTPDKPENVGGCDFHWKQLLRRKLEDYRITEDLIKALMKRIEMLTVLTYEEIPKGIAYIRAHIDEGCYKSQFDAFWRYFLKNFMRKSTRYDDPSTGLYLFTSWNLTHLLDARGRLKELDEDGYSVLVNRTNNPLERFNRKLNERIPRHPTVQVLVENLKDICNEYVDTMKDIKYKKYKAPKHLPVPIPVIPADFASFKFPN